MNQEKSDSEDSVGETGTGGFVDATTETEVELRLPWEVNAGPGQIPKDVPINSRAVKQDEVAHTRVSDVALHSRNPIDSYRGSGHSRWSSVMVDASSECSVQCIRDWHNAGRMLGYK